MSEATQPGCGDSGPGLGAHLAVLLPASPGRPRREPGGRRGLRRALLLRLGGLASETPWWGGGCEDGSTEDASPASAPAPSSGGKPVSHACLLLGPVLGPGQEVPLPNASPLLSHTWGN